MCKWGTDELVDVHIDADLSCDEQEKWKSKAIDKCIAPIVRALQLSGINMRSSCCGHGKAPGHITLADGRELIIPSNREMYEELLLGWAERQERKKSVQSS